MKISLNTTRIQCIFWVERITGEDVIETMKVNKLLELVSRYSSLSTDMPFIEPNSLNYFYEDKVFKTKITRSLCQVLQFPGTIYVTNS